MADLFKEIIPSILQTKKYVLENEKDYVSFVVNKALSFHYDCILYANEMNVLCNLDRRMQYDYYINSVRAYKRPYSKWYKKEQNDDIQVLMEHYQVSELKAREMLSVLSIDQIDDIRKQQQKGGLKR